jgi:hypothetical protein
VPESDRRNSRALRPAMMSDHAAMLWLNTLGQISIGTMKATSMYFCARTPSSTAGAPAPSSPGGASCG